MDKSLDGKALAEQATRPISMAHGPNEGRRMEWKMFENGKQASPAPDRAEEPRALDKTRGVAIPALAAALLFARRTSSNRPVAWTLRAPAPTTRG